jgi:hypothetical protein
METARSEKAPGEKIICLYPGCDQEAVDPPRKDNIPTRQGPPPRYCEKMEHNAASAFHELKRLEKEKEGASS